MPFTTGTETELPELATGGAERSPEPDDIEYPEGRWTAPSVLARACRGAGRDGFGLSLPGALRRARSHGTEGVLRARQ